VVAPTTPYDAKGLLIQSIRDDNPVMFVEHRMLHNMKGHVPEESYTVPFGKARVLQSGRDITIVGLSYMAVECLRAHQSLQEIGIDAEIIDPVSLSPLDIDTIAGSVMKTGRLLVVDTAWTMCGAGAEIITQVMEQLQGIRSFAARRMGYAPVPCPTTRPLENLFYPSPQTIANAAHSLVNGSASSWLPESIESPELVQFKGPF
jgi:pyruvate/2-oxoglutarate/acetoin dehydrogenase E1 component